MDLETAGGDVIEVCAGYGGLFMGLSRAVPGLRLAAYAEIDPGASAIMAHHHPGVPNLGDVKAIDWSALARPRWLIGGYPCQPFSDAGKRLGTDDPRHLWPYIAPGIEALRPDYVLFENVRGHVRRGLAEVCDDLKQIGYGGAWAVVRASDVGAPHQRARIFILASRHAAPGVVEVPRGAFAVPAQRRPLGEQVSPLLPTPEAKLASSGPDYARMSRPDSGGQIMTTAVHLLPTPASRDSKGPDRRGERKDGSPRTDAQRTLPGIVVEGLGPPLLPSVARGVGSNGGPNQRGSRGDLAMPSVVHTDSETWGKFAPAIAHWERVAGRPAPAPLIAGGRGGKRLNPELPEWMMGVEPGHITAVPGLSFAAQLQAIGNGVVPQQAEYACRVLAMHVDNAPSYPRATLTLQQHSNRREATMAPTPPDNPVSTHALERAESLAEAFRIAAQYWRDRAAYLEKARKKGWKGTGEMLVFAAEQAESMAGELENTPADDYALPGEDGPRCASFRRSTDDDPAVCSLPRGHSGDHGQQWQAPDGWQSWPRKHSGEQCNVAMSTADADVRCLEPLGHDGEHAAPDSSGIEWTWTYGTEPVRHDPADDPIIVGDAPEQIHDNQCASTANGERCALTAQPPHGGNHIGTRGGRWPQDYRAPAEPDPPREALAVLGDTVITEVDPASMSITIGLDGTVHSSFTGRTEDGRTITVENMPTGSLGERIPAQRTEEPASMDAANPFGPVQPAPPSAALVPFRAPSIVVPLLPKAPVTEREYDSVSSIEAMAGCGMKYRLKYHENAPELPAWWLVGGKAFHRVVEQVEHDAARGTTTTEATAGEAWEGAFAHEIEQTELATGVLRQHWKAAKGTKTSGPENEQWWAENGKAMSVRYLIGRRALVEDGWELLRNGAGDLALELEFRFPLGFAGRPIRGFIDSVWINRAKQMVLVVDDKSGARPAESNFQLETYGAAVATLLRGSDMATWPVLGTYYNARKGEYSARIKIDTLAAARIADARSAMTWQAERAGVFMPRVTNMCKGCGVAASCPVMALKASEPLEPLAAGTDVEAPEW